MGGEGEADRPVGKEFVSKRAGGSGKLLLEIKATALGLVPPLESLVELSPAGFEPGLGAPPQEDLNRGREDGTHWIPGECDVSIRPGWYYHAAEDGRVKSVAELLEIWHASVGRGANLLLNLPVDRRGLVHEHDAARLLEWRAALDAIYAEDLARGARVRATDVRGGSERFGAENVLDGDPATYWATGDEVRAAALELEFARPLACDRIRLEEPIALGQRVRAFELEARAGGEWRALPIPSSRCGPGHRAVAATSG